MNNDVNVLCVMKGDERYVWLYPDKRRKACLVSMARFAANPELSFSWRDCVIASGDVRKGDREAPQ